MAAELVGGALLSAFLQVTFAKLASAEIETYFRGRKLNEKLLKRLNITLLSINAVVDDAEQKQIRNSHVKAWLDAVKDAAFDAEDLLDEIDYEVSRCKIEAESHSTNSKVWTFFTASVNSFDKEIESKMQEVLENLEYLASKKDILGLKEASSGFGVGSSRQVSQKLQSTSLPVESVIYGRDNDKEIIYNWLISDIENDNRQLSIISIVGMGGMGKTTLAQHLYNDPRMEEGKFDIKAWVCVSEEFDVCRVTKAILAAITGSTDDSTEINTLHVKLKEKLTGKRFFLVLDDVWNENRMQWEALQTPLNYGAKGSKVIVTTRSMKVASVMRSNNTRPLELLEEKHCWQLFAKHAFQGEDLHINPDLEEIGKKVVKKCQGLPLALKAIGSLLYTKSSLVEWESVLASDIWDLPEEESNIIPALILSYHHLPSHLKRCFAHCALFPKDYMFVKEPLILLWMAENFLQCPGQSKSMREVGEQYFNDLLLRSFFQQSKENEIHFVMHDLLNDLAKYVCGDFCFILEVGEAQNIQKITRHFSFLRNLHDASKRFETLSNANKLRTFLPLTARSNLPYSYCRIYRTFVHDLFSKFKLLRVLSLFGYSNVIELPDTIGDLKHLRSLDLSYTKIKKLPDSLCFLYNLQILKLSGCKSLEELPMNLHKLTNLLYLDFSGIKVSKLPMSMGKLKNLQVLSSFYVEKGSEDVEKGSESNIQLLGELNLHGELSISNLQNIVNPLDALAANLKNKVHLVKLELKWDPNNDDSQKEREVLEKLQPSKHLKYLTIRNYGGTRFPDWFGDNSLSNVVNLKLSNCKNCVSLPALGVLPSLKKLWITGLSGIVVIGSEFYGNGSSSSSVIPFASLETLEFKDMEGWEEWECKIVPGAFPHLRNLSIEDCPNLKEHLPEKLPCLSELNISNCEQLVASVPWAPAIDTLRLTYCRRLQIGYHPSTELMVIEDGPNRRCFDFLEYLDIICCDSLRTFPLDLFPKLDSLDMQECSNLEMISQENEHGHSLTDLRIAQCPRFVSFLKGGFFAPKLEYLWISKLESFKSLPECMHILFPSLVYLHIGDCPQLESFPDGGLPPNLKTMYLEKCSKHLIASLKWALGTNSSLEYLTILEMDVECFPDQGLLPLSLTSLSIRDFLNLKNLDYKGLCHLSLTRLELYNCPNLECLPVEGLPKSISTLEIDGKCLLLKQRCKKPNGEDWGKISNIECVVIDNVTIT